MMMNKRTRRLRILLAAAAVAALALVFVVEYAGGRDGKSGGSVTDVPPSAAGAGAVPAGGAGSARKPSVKPASLRQDELREDSAAKGAPAAEEDPQDEEERLVGEFDAMTDSFIRPVTGARRVEMKDISEFCAKFAKVPKARKEECLQRALNLIPDANVMLLAGILMDKSQDAKLVNLVFCDILNRDEDVKQPLLEQVFKDREHPNWADAAWILDVTGAR